MEFSRQEYWSGMPFPSSGAFPDPGTEPTSPALAGGFFTTEPPGKPIDFFWNNFYFSYCIVKLYLVLLYVFWLFSKLSTGFIQSSSEFYEHLYSSNYLELFIRYVLHLVLLGFHLVPSFGKCPSVSSFCPICWLYLYVFGSLFMFPDLGEMAFCRRHPLCPTRSLPSGP